MKKSLTKSRQLNAPDTSLAIRDGATRISRGAGASEITGEDFAKYSHDMLLSLQRLAADQREDALSCLLGATAAEAKRLMKEKHPA